MMICNTAPPMLASKAGGASIATRARTPAAAGVKRLLAACITHSIVSACLTLGAAVSALIIPPAAFAQTDTSGTVASDGSEIGIRTLYTLQTDIREPFDVVTNLILAFNPVTNDFYLYSVYSSTLMRLSLDGAIDTLAVLPIDSKTRGDLRMDVNPSGTRIYFWPKGLGKVHTFELQTREWRRIDDTVVAGYMYAHKAVMTPDDRIYAIGGYGFWEFRNHLLYFDAEQKGWLNTEAVGDVPPKFVNGQLSHQPETESMTLLVDLQLDDLKGVRYSIHRYDMPTRTWSLDTILKIDELRNRVNPFEILGLSTTYKYDPDRGLIAVDDRIIFYDLNNRRFMMLADADGNGREISDLSNTRFFYSPTLKTWLVIGLTRNRNQPVLMVKSLDLDDMRMVRISSTDWIALFRHQFAFLADPRLAWAVAGLCLLLLAAGLLAHRKKIRAAGPPHPPALTLVRLADGRIDLLAGTSKIHDNDPLFSRFLGILFEIKAAAREEIPLAELDATLFPRNTSSSQNTKMRSKLTDTINDLAGFPVLRVERSHLDRRYKALKVDLSRISINGAASQ